MPPSSPDQHQPSFIVLGAGVIGLTTALTLRSAYPSSSITIIAKFFPGDRSIEYASPWGGANFSPFSRDNGPHEQYDRITFHKFDEIAKKYPEAGIARQEMWAIYDNKIEDAGLWSDGTQKVSVL